jgi:hypothetical protein
VVGAIVKAFVALKPGFEPTRRCARAARHARKRLGPRWRRGDRLPARSCPSTRSGKIMRRLLKARELGLPEGDTSTLEAGRCDTQPDAAADAIRDLGIAAPSAPLSQMLRIRRFEERCAELYGAGKIRGFLHLYIGEEAVAVGVMQALSEDDAIVATYREHGHALARGMSMPARSWPRCTASRRAAAAAGAARCTCSTPPRASTAAMRSSAAALPLAVGLALADQMQGRPASPPASSARARGRGRVPRVAEPRGAVEVAGAVLCENNLYAMGTALERSSRRPTCARAASYACPRAVDGMDVSR